MYGGWDWIKMRKSRSNVIMKLIFTTFIVYFYIKKLIENLDIKKLNNVIMLHIKHILKVVIIDASTKYYNRRE